MTYSLMRTKIPKRSVPSIRDKYSKRFFINIDQSFILIIFLDKLNVPNTCNAKSDAVSCLDGFPDESIEIKVGNPRIIKWIDFIV